MDNNLSQTSDASIGGDIIKGNQGVVITGDGNLMINNVVIIQQSKDPEADQRHLYRYLRWLAGECTRLRLSAIDSGAARTDRSPINLPNVYIDLNTDLTIPNNVTLLEYLQGIERAKEAGLSEFFLSDILPSPITGFRLVAVLEALAHHKQMVLIGAPGSGKSTLISYLALTLAQAGMGQGTLSRLGETWTHGLLWPIRIILRQFAESLPADLNQGRAIHLWDFIQHELTNDGLAEAAPLVKQVALKSGALFLLDGLDEAGDPTRRARVLESVSDFMRTAGEKSRFLLTARPYAWETPEKRIADLPDAYRLADFGRKQIATFIARWYEALTAAKWLNATEAAEKTAELQQAIQSADLRTIAQNPLLLTLAATLHSNRARLPEDRADLYDEVVDLMLERWNQSTGADKSLLTELAIPTLKLSNLREAFQELAFEAHKQHIGQDGTADISKWQLLEAFEALLGDSLDKAKLVLEYIEQRAGLLLGLGEHEGVDRFTFPHRTFQEFLAACHLASLPDYSEQAETLARHSPAHWREVLLLAGRRAGAGRGISAADALIYGETINGYRSAGKPVNVNDLAVAVVAGEQLIEIGTAVLEKREQYKAVRRRATSWLVEAMTADKLELARRAAAGDVLARLGDPRFDPAAWYLPKLSEDEPLLGFMEISAETFIMGSDPQKDKHAKKWEQPQHSLDLPNYYLARYPVTVAQWRAFVADSRHNADERSLRGIDNHPVVWVHWHEAVEYCKWLTGKLYAWEHTPEPLASLLRKQGWQITLPSEAQWEKGARGTDGCIYPWGNEFDPQKCNTAHSEIKTTISVGIFPAGVSPYGIQDMSGNVWEWTRSLWGKDSHEPNFKYPYNLDDGREDMQASSDIRRVVRGGAFVGSLRHARTASRNNGVSLYRRDNAIGWRVACVSPPAR